MAHKRFSLWSWFIGFSVLAVPVAVIAATSKPSPRPDPGNTDGMPWNVTGKATVTKVAIQQATQAGELSKRPLNLGYALEPGDEVIGYRFATGYRVTKRSAQGVAWFQLAEDELADIKTLSGRVPCQCIKAPCNCPIVGAHDGTP
jgi:hypothetical protein